MSHIWTASRARHARTTATTVCATAKVPTVQTAAPWTLELARAHVLTQHFRDAIARMVNQNFFFSSFHQSKNSFSLSLLSICSCLPQRRFAILLSGSLRGQMLALSCGESHVSVHVLAVHESERRRRRRQLDGHHCAAHKRNREFNADELAARAG